MKKKSAIFSILFGTATILMIGTDQAYGASETSTSTSITENNTSCIELNAWVDYTTLKTNNRLNDVFRKAIR